MLPLPSTHCWSRPQILTWMGLLPIFSQNNLSLLPGFCHFYLWQSVGLSPQRVTKAVTVRHFHSLSSKRRDIFESAAPLSDMAVPKALPITAGRLEERRRRLYRDLFANKITGRHSPQGTIWLPHIPARITPASLFIDCSPVHTLHLVKQQAQCSKLKNLLQAINHQGDRCQHNSP